MTKTSQLHLPDLTIKGFRGIDELSISRLGRVTLLAGKNGVGKTTVLDAVRVYAARGRYSTLSRLLWDREEVAVTTDESSDIRLAPDLRSLFHGRDVSQKTSILVGPSNVTDHLTIKTTTLISEQTNFFEPETDSVPKQVLQVEYGGNEQILPWSVTLDESFASLSHMTATVRRILRQYNKEEPPTEIECESLGPGLPNNNDLSRYWDGVALTDDEERAVTALRMVFGKQIVDMAVIGDHQAIGRTIGQRAMVRIKEHERPIPLKSLGDGALRLLGVALALANSRNGFLLIDEAENGIHHSIQRDYWRMVLQTAQENNVQVLATTHSWDCVTGFAQAATELEDVEGVLVRLSRSNGELRAIEYPEEELAIAAEQGIEVR